MTSVMLEQFRRVAHDRPDEVLLVAPQEARGWTAPALLDVATGIRTRLCAAGLRRGDAVLSTLGNHSAFVALTLACLAEGWPLLAADRLTPEADVAALAARWRPAALVAATSPDGLGSLADPAMPAQPVADGATMVRLATADPPGRYRDAVLLKLTSGSSGTPKVTLTAERHLLADVEQIAAAMDIGPTTRQLGVIPLSHSYGFSNLLLPLLWQGSPLLLLTGFSPAAVGEEARRFGAETFAGVPFMFDHIARHVTSPFPTTIRTVLSAGAPLSFETVAVFHRSTSRKIHSFYGSSETGGICYDGSPTLDPAVPVGRPLGAASVTLTADPEAPDGSGRVTVRGPAVVDGYADDVDAEAFADGAFVTGDFGRWRPDGRLELTGRATAVVNVAGRKVWPGEVEAALRALPEVRDAIVMGVNDARRGQALGACVAVRRPITAAGLRTALARHLAPHKLPRIVVQVDELPLTPRGKPDRQAIAARLAEAGDRG